MKRTRLNRSWQRWPMLAAALLLALTAASSFDAAPAARIQKVVAERGVVDHLSGASLWHDYGAFALYRVPADSLARLPQAAQAKVSFVEDRIEIDAAPFNPLVERPAVPEGFEAAPNGNLSLHLVQFVGPLKDSWLEAVKAAGARPIHYVHNNAYLVWTDAATRGALGDLAAAGDFVQYAGPFHPWMKLSPTLRDRYEGKARRFDADEVIPVVIQMVRHDLKSLTENAVRAVAKEKLSDWTPILEYQNIDIKLRAGDIAALAARGDINWIGERLPRRMYDEVQNQIVAGNFNGGMTGPSAPGYLAFLSGLGFPTTSASYPVVDVTDDGLGSSGTIATGDPTFLDMGVGPGNRVVAVSNCTGAADGRNIQGHGHLNANIVGGYDARTGFPTIDPNGYNRGLGVNPFTRLAGTRIFAPGFSQVNCGNNDIGLILRNWQNGARISSNSWGCSGCAGSYDDSSQAYDVGTRDADGGTAGNQELIYIFAAGNSGSGAGTVGTPGNGKNMITVGASENQRPTDEGGAWSDGCGIAGGGADNAMDVIGFSSRGPSPGNRRKPEVIAPGTHIHGTTPSSGYTGGTVCDTFRPPSQTIYAASSGTSHSTPAVSGVASLAYYWIENGNVPANVSGGAPPSPALMKAWLSAHTTYLTGVGANDTLPSNAQGYGMPNLTTMFDGTSRFILDQTTVFAMTGDTYTFNGAVADNTKPVKIVVAYTDQAGAIGTSPQVNNLNLTATVGGNNFTGNVFTGQWSTVGGGTADTANNYEAVFVQPGASGAITFTVTAANIAGDGVPGNADTTDQDFAVVCYNCAQQPTYSLGATPNSVDVCTPSDAVYTVNIGSILGFNTNVTLSATGLPGSSAAGFSTNPVTPPGSSTLTLSNTNSVTAGSYMFTVDATDGGSNNQSRNLGLNVFTGLPGVPTLTAPANGSTGVATNVALTWTGGAANGGGKYTVEVATDSGFANIVATGTNVMGTTFSPGGLNTNTRYFWRARSGNICGTDANSPTFSFITAPAAGDCAFGLTAITDFETSFESGSTGWTTGGTGSTWALSTDNPHSGTMVFRATSPAAVSDQHLISPPITLPPAGSSFGTYTLRYWDRQEIEDRTGGGCWDGAVLDISTNGGSSWTRIEAELMTNPYDGLIQSGFSNPLALSNGWCGDPQEYFLTVVNLNAFAGQTVNFRWRKGTDTTVAHPGWWVDDVRVQHCPSTSIFANGFEAGNTSAWSSTTP